MDCEIHPYKYSTCPIVQHILLQFDSLRLTEVYYKEHERDIKLQTWKRSKYDLQFTEISKYAFMHVIKYVSMLVFCNDSILIQLCFIKTFNIFYRKANDDSNKNLWTQKKKELDWNKDERNWR